MIQFTAELEDVCFTATREVENDMWVVVLSESERAQRDFGRVGEQARKCEIVLNGEEMGALLFLAVNGEDETPAADMYYMYSILEPKLTSVPLQMRPIP